MPTCPPRNTTKAKKFTSAVDTGNYCMLDHHAKSEVSVAELEIKWGKQSAECPTPPCRNTYTWFSAPKTMYNVKKLTKERCSEKDPPEPYKNVMCERRVIRGTNFTATNAVGEPPVADKITELKRRQNLRGKYIGRNRRNVIGTPPPVAGRRHETIQTEKYLEELADRPPEFNANTQTDLFLERPLSPPYIPAKTGIDVATEIPDGDLFDFDTEVEPILETLVGHCIEQGLLEVSHEEEVAELRKQQEEYIALREADLAELRRLEAEELRLKAEKDRRLQQDSIARELDEKMDKSVTAAKLLQGHIATLLPDVLENLEPISDGIKKEKLEKTICPWLTKEVAEEVGHIVDSREILTAIIQEIIKQRATIYAGYREDVKMGSFEEEGIGEKSSSIPEKAYNDEEEKISTQEDFDPRM